MSKAKELHRDAMHSARKADEALEQRNIAAYKKHMRKALDLETSAAILLKEKFTAEPTRSVLFRSAASIAVSCGEYKQAEWLIIQALRGSPPKEIKDELLELFNNVLFETNSISLGNKIQKRAFDVVFSIMVLIVLSPIFLLISILIKLESNGPVINKEIRFGLDNKVFYCILFRTAKVSKDSSAINDEANLTRVGQFLLKTGISDLPQFVNVLKGDMSVVGPRPDLFSIKDYAELLNTFSFSVRQSAIPGLVDLAQEMKSKNEPKSYAQYAEHWSISLDMKIIFVSFLSFLRRFRQAFS